MGVTASLLMGSNADRIANSLEVIAIAQSKGIDGDVSFDGMAQLVKSGLGAKAFPVGTTINVAMETEITATVSGTGITDATVDDDVFISAEHEIGKTAYEFTYDGTAWRDSDGRVVDLDAYGITVTGTPANGDAIVVHETAENVAFNVMDHDYDTPVKSAIPHSMTIAMQNLHSVAVTYDPREALIFCPEGLTAGTRYYITCDHAAYDSSTAQDGDFGFTPTVDVPAGGYVRHDAMGHVNLEGTYSKSDVLSGHFITYGTDFAQIEQLATDEGSEGTYLGKTTSCEPIYMDPNYPDVNYTQRNGHGSNNWENSYIRQYLNSSGTGWWKQQTKFDFPPANVATIKGFLTGIDPSLRENMQTVKKRVVVPIQDVAAGAEMYKDVEDKVFLLSNFELYGQKTKDQYETSYGMDNTLKTVRYAYYVGASASDRIKLRKNGNPAIWYMRSIASMSSGKPDSATGVRQVNTTGNVTNIQAGTVLYLSPACVIG